MSRFNSINIEKLIFHFINENEQLKILNVLFSHIYNFEYKSI